MKQERYFRIKAGSFSGRKMKYVKQEGDNLILALLSRKVGVVVIQENGKNVGDMKSWEKGETFVFSPEQVEEID